MKPVYQKDVHSFQIFGLTGTSFINHYDNSPNGKRIVVRWFHEGDFTQIRVIEGDETTLRLSVYHEECKPGNQMVFPQDLNERLEQLAEDFLCEE
jgi:hypothetical protein